jgi:hypothetical protein
MPSDLPRPEDPDVIFIPDNRMHNWFYDLSLAVRPFARMGGATRLSSFYLFAGGGAFSPNVEDGERGECVESYIHGHACLPYDWREATVGQVTAGLGASVIPLTPALGLFVEGAVHGGRDRGSGRSDQVAQEGGVEPGAGAEFEDAHAGFQGGLFEHHRDHAGLGAAADRGAVLVVLDVHGRVGVGLFQAGVGDEGVPGD